MAAPHAYFVVDAFEIPYRRPAFGALGQPGIGGVFDLSGNLDQRLFGILRLLDVEVLPDNRVVDGQFLPQHYLGNQVDQHTFQGQNVLVQPLEFHLVEADIDALHPVPTVLKVLPGHGRSFR